MVLAHQMVRAFFDKLPMPLLCVHAASFFVNRAGGCGCLSENLMKAPSGTFSMISGIRMMNLLFG
jgi:hypothetical protein